MFLRHSSNKKSELRYSLISEEDNYIDYFLFKKWFDLTQTDFANYLGLVTLKTFISISLPLLMKVHEKEIITISLIVCYPLS